MNLVGPFLLRIFDDISSVVRLSALFSEGKKTKTKTLPKEGKDKKEFIRIILTNQLLNWNEKVKNL